MLSACSCDHLDGGQHVHFVHLLEVLLQARGPRHGQVLIGWLDLKGLQGLAHPARTMVWQVQLGGRMYLSRSWPKRSQSYQQQVSRGIIL